MSVLNDKQIGQILTRMAYEIIEQNISAKKILLAGINNNGYRLASLLADEIAHIKSHVIETELVRVKLNAAKPLDGNVEITLTSKELKGKHVILVDDVANTGRTLFYACRPFMETMVKKLQVAVLVDRKHKSWPIQVDFVGMSLATTVKDHIDVKLSKKGAYRAAIS